MLKKCVICNNEKKAKFFNSEEKSNNSYGQKQMHSKCKEK